MGVSGGGSIRNILVVDDDERITNAMVRSLGTHRHVEAAHDGGTALELARRSRPDLIIMDLRLGTASGLDAIEALREELPECVIALVSGYASIDIAVLAVKAGADLVLPKPISGPEVLRRVDEGLCDDSTKTPSLADVEAEHIARVLSDCGGNVSEAARRLGIYRSSLQRKLRKHAGRS